MNTSDRNGDTSFSTPGDGSEYSSQYNEIVNAATSYLDSGMVDEAEHLVEEARQLGGNTPDVSILVDRIAEVRHAGEPQAAEPEPESQPRNILNIFTRPLPDVDRQPREVQRMISIAERDFLAGRVWAAYDMTLSVSAVAPSFLPNYARMVELKVAMGEFDAAEELLQIVRRCYALYDRGEDRQLNAIHIALYPDDVAKLVQHARYLLSERGSLELEPVVPAAIEATVASDPEVARELASVYVELRPDDDEARRGYLRSVVTSGEHDEIINAFKRHVALNATAPDLLFLRAASLTIDDHADWLTWLEKAAVATRASTELYANVRSAIEDSARFMPDGKRYLSGTVLGIASGDWDNAATDLERWDAVNSEYTAPLVEQFIASVARTRLLQHTGARGLIQALSDSVVLALADETSSFANETQMFHIPVSVNGLLEQLVHIAPERNASQEAIDVLRHLRDQHPEQLDIRARLADMYIAGGRVNEGIRELRSVAQHHERAGNYQAMVTAMRKMSVAVPTNTQMKSMLADIYLRRGVLDEALQELESLGELYLTKNRHVDAVKAFTRAAEIASTIGDFNHGNELFERGVQADPENIPIRHAAVAFYLQTGNVERATSQLREVARIMLAKDEPDEAVAALHQIIGLAPNDPEAYHKLGEVLTSMGQYTQAERVYRRLSSFTPDDPVLAAKQSALSVLATTQ